MDAILLFRKTRKIIVLITMLMIIAGCGDKSVSNISTSEAYTKYERKTESKSLVAFSESRENPLKWFDSIPERRLLDAFEGRQLKLTANPGEIFVYQIGVWATNMDLNDLQISFSDLKGKAGKISSSKMTGFSSAIIHSLPLG